MTLSVSYVEPLGSLYSTRCCSGSFSPSWPFLPLRTLYSCSPETSTATSPVNSSSGRLWPKLTGCECTQDSHRSDVFRSHEYLLKDSFHSSQVSPAFYNITTSATDDGWFNVSLLIAQGLFEQVAGRVRDRLSDPPQLQQQVLLRRNDGLLGENRRVRNHPRDTLCQL